MSISRKLFLTSLLVLALFVFNVAITLFIVQRLKDNVLQLVLVAEPLEEAALEMEINAGETANAVFEYMWDHEESVLERMRDSERDFERHAREFQRLAETAEEQALGRRVIALYADFKELGSEITAMSRLRLENLAVFRKDVLEIDEVIGRQLQAAIDRSSAGATAKLEAALEMEINILEAFAAIEAYALVPDPGLLERIADSEADFKRFEAQYRNTGLSAGEKKWPTVVDRDFAEAVAAGKAITELTDQMREKTAKFENNIEEIDRLLDEEVQVYIHEQTERAARDARGPFAD